MDSKPLPVCEFDTKDLIVQLDMAFPARVCELEGVVKRVMDVIQSLDCAVGKEFEVELGLYEALVNAVEHGCGHDSSKSVQLTVCCDKSRGILMIVRDSGPGFDVASIPSPIEGENVYSSGGRGIFLINRLMDEVHYTKGGTEIRMVKR